MTTPGRVSLPKVWQRRFAFYDERLEARPVGGNRLYRALAYLSRSGMTTNAWAFFLGPIYFFVKGMWRKGITLALMAAGAMGVLYIVHASSGWTLAVSVVFALVYTFTANRAYYLHWVRHSESWNPFEPIR
ncbi:MULTISPECIES: DUF2628 domain-containing protein [unclassified Mycobacteroides]|uniref:DUF2628 domain-containing protein n=1 Tax=unclassified Mycobacteroides TaxID=2618759 RepID=UPI0013295D85|nr:MULTISPECIES: DUF2628 domain-containing protein [unclassified Mycobacteroides]MUM15888.1 hypothetical protein [Mycobacteroides sp. CBMA 326]